MSKRILIVGGGLAGTITANGLCRQLGGALGKGEVSITVLGNTDQHMYQPGLLYIPFGTMRESELFRDQRKVLDRRINFLIDPAINIDVDGNKVECQSGKSIGYDY
ncbi:MAG: NAD(P)/FAD-dependent oxidoreductase, partial [Alphaproteobacteria bacterium]|nr:NAD(P)/FAD-dependent oxidoreductase [Alphaproteobacteria bacterium]